MLGVVGQRCAELPNHHNREGAGVGLRVGERAG